jgi:hypothetical protein
MNISRNYLDDIGEDNSTLEPLHRTIPHWREILAAVKAGHIEFVDMLANTGLLAQFGSATSAVHAYHEIEVHAFILGNSIDRPLGGGPGEVFSDICLTLDRRFLR